MTTALKMREGPIELKKIGRINYLNLFDRNRIVMGRTSHTIKFGTRADLQGGYDVDVNALEKIATESLEEAKLTNSPVMPQIDVSITFPVKAQYHGPPLRSIAFETHGEIDFKKEPELTKAVGASFISLKHIFARRMSQAEIVVFWD